MKGRSFEESGHGRGKTMARDAALVITFGSAVRGREAKSLDVFTEVLTFLGKQAADGRCSQPEPYFATDASNGMIIVRGMTDGLAEITESEEYDKLLAKSQMVVEDLKIHWYLTGEEIERGTRIFAEAGSELGYM
jgi:hypothetical protein